MSWIGKWIGYAAAAPGDVFILEKLTSAHGAPEPREIIPDEEYLTVIVKSLHVPFRRLQFSTFHGTVMSQISLAHTGTGEASFHVVSSPKMLRSADPANLPRVIALDQVLLDRVPYRGGSFRIEAGLFAEKSADLAQPLIDVVSKVAGAAGVAFVSAAQPFMEPLRHAMDVLSGVPQAFTLLIGFYGTLIPLTSGCIAVIASSRDRINVSSLKLRANSYELIYADGRDCTDIPYMVLAIETSKNKDDWTRIPDLLAANHRIKHALTQTASKNRNSAVKEAIAHFKLTALTSPDLLFNDAVRIVRIAEERLTTIMDAGVAKISADIQEWPDDLAAL